MTEKHGSARYVAIAILLSLAMTGLAVRLVFLHLGSASPSRSMSSKTRTYKETLAVPRGRILDGSLSANILAANIGAKDIWADPSVLIASTKVGVAAAEVARLKLPGVHLADTTTRSYPQGEMLCHILGFVNHDGIGSWGVEQCMDKYLKGTPGLLESQLDGRRREMLDRRLRYAYQFAGRIPDGAAALRRQLQRQLGPEHPLAQTVLAGMAPGSGHTVRSLWAAFFTSPEMLWS